MTATFFRRGRGRSINAAIAESNERMPLTRAAQCVAAEAHITLALAKRALQITWDGEWHHVGKYAAETNYYDTQAALDWLGKCVSVERLATESRKYDAGQRRAEKAVATRAAKKAAARLAIQQRQQAEIADYVQRKQAEAVERAARRAANLVALVAKFITEPTFGRAAELTRQGFDPSALLN